MIRAMQTFDIPYEAGYANKANADLEKQAKEISAELMKDKGIQQIVEMEGIKSLEYSKIVALVAYLQRIGTDIKNMPEKDRPEH
jgi:cytochrome c oxidase cbb3-type subunit I/II